MLKNYSVSVVIATLGGKTLARTIDFLNSGTIIPNEILVCIPLDELDNASHIVNKNIRIISTEHRGQVAQRAIGFKNALNEFVLQIDDDMQMHYRCLEYLLDSMGDSQKISVAPVLVDENTGQSVYRTAKYNAFISKIYYWFINGVSGYCPGSIDNSGTPHGIDPWAYDEELLQVDWLAGGCVLHRKNNLILQDFYPFEGKAFGEDIIHSYLLKQSGVSLVINSKAICSMELVSHLSYSSKSFIANMIGDFKARKFYLDLSNQKSHRIYFFYAIFTILFFVNKFALKIKSI